MIPNHDQFIKAIHDRHKVCVRFFSHADNGVLDRVCAPVDYGPDTNSPDGLNRYRLWNYIGEPRSQMLSLVPQQIIDLRVLGEHFQPAEIPAPAVPWAIAREWNTTAASAPTSSIAAPSTQPAITMTGDSAAGFLTPPPTVKRAS